MEWQFAGRRPGEVDCQFAGPWPGPWSREVDCQFAGPWPLEMDCQFARLSRRGGPCWQEEALLGAAAPCPGPRSLAAVSWAPGVRAARRRSPERRRTPQKEPAEATGSGKGFACSSGGVGAAASCAPQERGVKHHTTCSGACGAARVGWGPRGLRPWGGEARASPRWVSEGTPSSQGAERPGATKGKSRVRGGVGAPPRVNERGARERSPDAIV